MSMITIKMIMRKIKMVMMEKKKTSFSRYFQKVCRLHLCPENSPGASLCSKSSLYLFTLIMIMMTTMTMTTVLMIMVTCN